MKSRIAFTLLLLLTMARAGAQAPTSPMADEFLDRLAGKWVLTGTILNRETTHDVTIEWVLNHQYLRIHEVARDRDDKGGPQYEAIVFIGADRAAAGYTCLWLDTTTGDGLTIEGMGHARRVGDTIPFVFRGKDGKESFRNTFSYERREDSWKWFMENVQDGKPQPFARLQLVRAK
jgi:hypothetical protein